MSIQKVSLLVFALFVTSCGRLGTNPDPTLDTSVAPDASNGSRADSRPFSGQGDSGGKSLTLTRYAELLHQDLTGQPAPASFTRGFVDAYQSGRGIASIVADALRSTPALTAASEKLYQTAQSSPRDTSSGRGVRDGSRGFSATDLVLLYLAYRNNDSSSYGYSYGYNYSSGYYRGYYDAALPYLLTSRQYYYYLLYSYLLN